jgi:hypothetical protein
VKQNHVPARLVSRQFDAIIMGQREHDTEPMLWKNLLEQYLPHEPLRERILSMGQSGEWRPRNALDYVQVRPYHCCSRTNELLTKSNTILCA